MTIVHCIYKETDLLRQSAVVFYILKVHMIKSKIYLIKHIVHKQTLKNTCTIQYIRHTFKEKQCQIYRKSTMTYMHLQTKGK